MEKISEQLYAELRALLNEIKIDFGGGCSLEKGYMMAWLIANFNLKTTVDIGVYRGRSLFSQALCHARYSRGVVYGVDPWEREQAREHDNEPLRERINEFLDKTDFDAINEDVNRLNVEKGFTDHCVLIRKKSEDAITRFAEENVTFDLIHIDGNHDTATVMKDIELYVPLVAARGFTILDDVSWTSVRPAVEAVSSRHNLVYQKTDSNNDFAIFWGNHDAAEVAQMRLTLEEIGNGLEIRDLGLRNAEVEALLLEHSSENAKLQSSVDETKRSRWYSIWLACKRARSALVTRKAGLRK